MTRDRTVKRGDYALYATPETPSVDWPDGRLYNESATVHLGRSDMCAAIEAVNYIPIDPKFHFLSDRSRREQDLAGQDGGFLVGEVLDVFHDFLGLGATRGILKVLDAAELEESLDAEGGVGGELGDFP
jgi:hypothetical protein